MRYLTDLAFGTLRGVAESDEGVSTLRIDAWHVSSYPWSFGVHVADGYRWRMSGTPRLSLMGLHIRKRSDGVEDMDESVYFIRMKFLCSCPLVDLI